MTNLGEESPDAVTYEELAELERDFDEIDNEIIRHQYHLSKDLYARRNATISKIPKFWALALEQVPEEISHYIQPSDSEIFAECLTNIEVDRFEIGDDGNETSDGLPAGDPRSLKFRFEFSPNKWFDDTVLEKKFWWRRSDDGWTGLVSEPVRIHWKRGKDPTKGLMDGALALWQARQAAGDMRKRDLPEFDSMAKITETWNGENTSFFTWFAFVSARRWVSGEESARAVAREKERRRKGAKDGKDEDPVQTPDGEQLERQVEAHEDGDGLAAVIAEDFWPGAIRYFTQAQESNDLTDDDFEEQDDEDEDEDEVEAPRMENVDLAGMVAGVTADAADSDDADQPPRKKKR